MAYLKLSAKEPETRELCKITGLTMESTSTSFSWAAWLGWYLRWGGVHMGYCTLVCMGWNWVKEAELTLELERNQGSGCIWDLIYLSIKTVTLLNALMECSVMKLWILPFFRTRENKLDVPRLQYQTAFLYSMFLLHCEYLTIKTKLNSNTRNIAKHF